MARITEAVVNKWWGDCCFREMEKITGFRMTDFDPEDGYQEFVDVCDEWWNKLSFGKKKELYISLTDTLYRSEFETLTMEKIFLVYDEYRCDGIDEGTSVIACATMDIAIRKIKVLLEWYLKNSYLNQFVDEQLNLIESELNEYDIWEIDDDSVEIFIEGKNTSLNLHIAEVDVIDE